VDFFEGVSLHFVGVEYFLDAFHFDECVGHFLSLIVGLEDYNAKTVALFPGASRSA
jgi:hypothetical protein